MVVDEKEKALYPSRAGAGAELGVQLNRRIAHPTLVLGVTPTGVEVAANAAKAIGCPFDVVVGAHVRLGEIGVVGAIAEDADAVMDINFQPRFGMLDALNEAIDKARRAIKTERLLFRGQRPIRSVEGVNVIVVDGHPVSPWKLLAAAEAVRGMGAPRVLIGAPVGTMDVQNRIRARRFEFVCPTLLKDPSGHPKPFGDPHDPSAERLRSIVVAREAA
jgi:predicted phosphoribosyltransferase